MFQKLQRKSEHIFCSVNFSENHVIYEIMWQKAVELYTPNDNITRAYPLQAGLLRIKHTLTLYNTYWFFTATVFTYTCLMLRYMHIANLVHYLLKKFCIGQQLHLMTRKVFTVWKVNFSIWHWVISFSEMVTVACGKETSYFWKVNFSRWHGVISLSEMVTEVCSKETSYF
jgi:hypothetical protein